MVPTGNSTASSMTSLGIERIPAIPTIKAATAMGTITCILDGIFGIVGFLFLIFILNELLASFALHGGVAFLGGKETGDITLDEFIQNHSATIGNYREDTKNFLYVKPAGNHWHEPSSSIKRLKERQKFIEDMINALHIVLHVIVENSDKELLDNFHISRDGEHLSLQFDTL